MNSQGATTAASSQPHVHAKPSSSLSPSSSTAAAAAAAAAAPPTMAGPSASTSQFTSASHSRNSSPTQNRSKPTQRAANDDDNDASYFPGQASSSFQTRPSPRPPPATTSPSYSSSSNPTTATRSAMSLSDSASPTAYANNSASSSHSSRRPSLPHLDLAKYPQQQLLKILAALLTQIATSNDRFRSANGSDEREKRRNARRGTRSPSGRGGGLAGAGEAMSRRGSESSQGGGGGTTTPAVPQTLESRTTQTVTTASMGALGTPSSTLCFHARNVPSISIESYLLRILKYCPTTNDVFLSLLVYFDRMSRMGAGAPPGSRSRSPAAAAEAAAAAASTMSSSAEMQSSRSGRAGDADVAMHAQQSNQGDAIGQAGAAAASGAGFGPADVIMKDSSASSSTTSSKAANGSGTANSSGASTPGTFDADPDGQGGHPGMKGFVIDSYNVHRLVIAGVTVASKFFSDVFYTNSRYAKVGGLPVHELNQLELQFLLLNDFHLMIPLSELQSYADQLMQYGADYGSYVASSSAGTSAPPTPASTAITPAANLPFVGGPFVGGLTNPMQHFQQQSTGSHAMDSYTDKQPQDQPDQHQRQGRPQQQQRDGLVVATQDATAHS